MRTENETVSPITTIGNKGWLNSGVNHLGYQM